ncbi:PcfJ domain-containing protein [Priestia filamentosa]|uniref:PcfJ domain-containing protein n=1 Tax=Priestia filamentosa TaxID=1402861 RepID=UPI0002F2DF45|nr:PcfJ domain-containing protein [Priestia filamentosa]
MNVIYKNPFKQDFRIHSHDLDRGEPVDLVYCATCNEISPALVNEEAKHKFSCPLCQKRIIRKHTRDMYVTKVYGKIFHYEEKVVYSCGFYHHLLKYCHKTQKMRKISVLYQYNISHNKKTGYTYLLKKSQNPKYNKLANLSLGSLPLQWKLIGEHLTYIEQDPVFKEFAKQLLPNWFTIPEPLRVNELAFYVRYPQLGLLPYEATSSMLFRVALRKAKRKREELSHLPFKEKVMINWLLDAPITKRERKYVYQHPYLLILQRLLVKLFTNSDIRYDVLTTLDEIIPLKQGVLDAFAENMFSRDYGTEFLELKAYFSSEKQFAKRFIELFKQVRPNPNPYYASASLSEEVSITVKDIIRMKQNILAIQPDFVMPKIYNIKDLHDSLSIVTHQLKQRYQEISYTMSEKKRMESSDIGMSDFLLAKSNHELMEVGRQLNICVGSYAQEALEKNLYIVLIRSKQGREITHCLEITHQREWSLAQAKGKYNEIPSVEVQQDIQEYCSRKGIRIKTSDIHIDLAS